MAQITVTGTAFDPAQVVPDAGANNKIRFMLDNWFVSAAGKVIIPKIIEAVWEDLDGTFLIVLESTHDGGPPNRSYRVQAVGVIDGIPLEAELCNITIPAAPATQDIADLLCTTGPAPPEPGLTIEEIRVGLWWIARDFGLTPTIGIINKIEAKPNASQYLAGGDSNWGYRSNNGVTWEQFRLVGAPDNGNVKGIAWNGSVWAAGCTSFIFTAPDAFGTWTKKQTVAAFRMRYFGDVAGRFYCVDNGNLFLRYSDDNWATLTAKAIPATGSNDIGFSPALALYVIVQNTGRIYTSPDLTTWTLRTSGVATDLNAITWSAALGVFIIVGDVGVILYSPDGITWSSIKTPYNPTTSAAILSDVIWTGDEFLFVTTEGNAGICNIYASPNGIQWTQRPVPDKKALHGIWANLALGQYIVVGADLWLATLGIE